MTLRSFIDAVFDVTGERYSTAAARTFLLAITEDGFKETIDILKPSTFSSNLRLDRNMTAGFACEIEAAYIPSELKDYLNEISNGRGGKQRLCDAFREYCPEIEPKQAVKKIAELFEQMLREAKQGRKKRTKTDAAKSTRAMFQNTEKLDFLLSELTVRFAELHTDYLKASIEYDTASPDKKKALDEGIIQKHHTFYGLNDRLFSFVCQYQAFTDLSTLYDLGMLLVLDFFRPWNGAPKSIIPEETPDDYRTMLAKVKKAAPNFIK